jgi:hypothetical protein
MDGRSTEYLARARRPDICVQLVLLQQTHLSAEEVSAQLGCGAFAQPKERVEEGYLNVRKWTSKIDLFKKKYIIVPINEKYGPLLFAPRQDTNRRAL